MSNTNHGQCEVKVVWQSEHASHCERHYFDRVNFRRDTFPGLMGDQLETSSLGEWITGTLCAGDMIDAHNESLVHKLHRNCIAIGTSSAALITLRVGRFYPRNLISGIPGVNSAEIAPLRVVAMDDGTITFDLNHPLAGKTLELGIRVCTWLPNKEEPSGRGNDIVLDTLFRGPGMQSNTNKNDTDFYGAACFKRADERDDAETYTEPNLTALIDATAEQHIQSLYAQHLQTGMHVLDLMAGHDSHLPDIDNLRVTGLGLNQEELNTNPVLSQRIVHDINREATLPCDDNSIDAAVYSLSIEYLTQPQVLFNEVARVCRPGAPFIITFSVNPVATKAIAQWPEMYDFERMGLVLDYFRKTDKFDQLHTESFREWPRPEGDPEHEQKPFSDSVYAVWGSVR